MYEFFWCFYINNFFLFDELGVGKLGRGVRVLVGIGWNNKF